MGRSALGKDGLTDQQRKFCQLYIENKGNGSEAYRQSYNCGGSTYAVIKANVSRLIRRPRVAAELSRLRGLNLNRHLVTVDRVVEEYAKLAFLDARKAFDADGRLLPLDQLDDDTAAALAGLEVEETYDGSGDRRVNVGRVKKIRLADKIRALDSLAKYLKMFVEQHDHNVNVTHNAVDADIDRLLAGVAAGGQVPSTLASKRKT